MICGARNDNWLPVSNLNALFDSIILDKIKKVTCQHQYKKFDRLCYSYLPEKGDYSSKSWPDIFNKLKQSQCILTSGVSLMDAYACYLYAISIDQTTSYQDKSKAIADFFKEHSREKSKIARTLTGDETPQIFIANILLYADHSFWSECLEARKNSVEYFVQLLAELLHERHPWPNHTKVSFSKRFVEHVGESNCRVIMRELRRKHNLLISNLSSMPALEAISRMIEDEIAYDCRGVLLDKIDSRISSGLLKLAETNQDFRQWLFTKIVRNEDLEFLLVHFTTTAFEWLSKRYTVEHESKNERTRKQIYYPDVDTFIIQRITSAWARIFSYIENKSLDEATLSCIKDFEMVCVRELGKRNQPTGLKTSDFIRFVSSIPVANLLYYYHHANTLIRQNISVALLENSEKLNECIQLLFKDNFTKALDVLFSLYKDWVKADKSSLCYERKAYYEFTNFFRLISQHIQDYSNNDPVLFINKFGSRCPNDHFILLMNHLLFSDTTSRAVQALHLETLNRFLEKSNNRISNLKSYISAFYEHSFIEIQLPRSFNTFKLNPPNVLPPKQKKGPLRQVLLPGNQLREELLPFETLIWKKPLIKSHKERAEIAKELFCNIEFSSSKNLRILELFHCQRSPIRKILNSLNIEDSNYVDALYSSLVNTALQYRNYKHINFLNIFYKINEYYSSLGKNVEKLIRELPIKFLALLKKEFEKIDQTSLTFNSEVEKKVYNTIMPLSSTAIDETVMVENVVQFTVFDRDTIAH